MSSVKIAELSQRSNVPVATIKYYLRLGLLPAGEYTAKNQADYDESHVSRIRLIRSLIELGRMSIADVTNVLAAVDDDSTTIHDAFGVAQDAMVPEQRRDTPEYQKAIAIARKFVRRHRFKIRSHAAVISMLADALVALSFQASGTLPADVAEAYLDSMVPHIRSQAEFEIANLPADDERSSMVEYTVVGTIGFEIAMNAIRRMALEHYSSKRFGTPAKK